MDTPKPLSRVEMEQDTVDAYEGERYPGQDNDSKISLARLKEVNDMWKTFTLSDQQSSHEHESDSAKKSVHFSDPNSWLEIQEDAELAEELRNSRISDFARKKADKERMERLLGPVLTDNHRQKVFQRLYGEQL